MSRARTNFNASTSPTSTSGDSVRPRHSRRISSQHYKLPPILPPPLGSAILEDNEKPSPLVMSSYTWWRIRKFMSRPLLWIVLFVVGAVAWWSTGGRRELSNPEVQLRLRELFPPEITKTMQFYPASNHKIHYVGRWTSAPNKLRIDGSFPGVYFDLNITNTTSLVLSLQNNKDDPAKPTTLPNHERAKANDLSRSNQYSQYSFTAASRLRVSSPPISLIALVDQEEYVILPNATSLTSVRMGDLPKNSWHSIRVIAPMTDNGGKGTVQFDGLWLDKGGQLLPVEGSSSEGHAEDEDDFDPESMEIGKKHRLGLGSMLGRFSHDQVHTGGAIADDFGDIPEGRRRRRVLEVITDAPSHLGHTSKKLRSGGSEGLLSGVMGWEYLLGEMFSVDHVAVAAEGMCLVHDCVGGTGQPSGMGDVFFRSGPVGSPHFAHPWPFSSYVPDVIILNLGASDFFSFETHLVDYNKTMGDMITKFEDTYVSLVKAIRTLAYPTHPSIIEMQRLGYENFADHDAPANIPIFIMRPFRGELEHATQGAVARLRSDGDKSVFWLDTTGWLEEEDTDIAASDFFIDHEDQFQRPHLTERGNQKVAIYLHMHVCRYLAAETDMCAFLPPEVYQGNVFDPAVATFDRYIENEKERQMKEIFWLPELDQNN